ncbi:nucleotidyltransferase domain-containing protein [Alkalihalobacillus sp. NPDC078783]
MKRNFSNRLSPMRAAQLFVSEHFSECDGALLAGSVVRGEATETSDLDLVIFEKSIPSSYRESFVMYNWPIEIFVHNLTSYQTFFKADYDQATPSMQRMVSEGLVIKDTGIITSIKKEANEQLMKGPEPWSDENIRVKRYFITDTLDDFIGSVDKEEDICCANTLFELVADFVLRTNRQWTGKSKWLIRSLKKFDADFTQLYVEAFNQFYKNEDKTHVIQLVDDVLKPHGGRFFHGFSLGKKDD